MTTANELMKAINDAITECKKHEVELKSPRRYDIDWDCENCKYEYICENLKIMVCDWYN